MRLVEIYHGLLGEYEYGSGQGNNIIKSYEDLYKHSPRDIVIGHTGGPMYGKPSKYKGIPRSEETKRKMSEKLKGRVFTKEWKQKLSDSYKWRDTSNMGQYDKIRHKNPNSKMVRDNDTGVVYDCIMDMRDALGISHDRWHKNLKHTSRFTILGRKK